MICRAISELTATRESLMFTITLPPIAETTVISAPATNPRFARNRLVSSFPSNSLDLIYFTIFAIVKGIIPYLLFFCVFGILNDNFFPLPTFVHSLVYANICVLSSIFLSFVKPLFSVTHFCHLSLTYNSYSFYFLHKRAFTEQYYLKKNTIHGILLDIRINSEVTGING